MICGYVHVTATLEIIYSLKEWGNVMLKIIALFRLLVVSLFCITDIKIKKTHVFAKTATVILINL